MSYVITITLVKVKQSHIFFLYRITVFHAICYRLWPVITRESTESRYIYIYAAVDGMKTSGKKKQKKNYHSLIISAGLSRKEPRWQHDSLCLSMFTVGWPPCFEKLSRVKKTTVFVTNGRGMISLCMSPRNPKCFQMFRIILHMINLVSGQVPPGQLTAPRKQHSGQLPP